MGFKEEFIAIVAKNPEDLTEQEFRFLVKRVGYLSDTERAKFQSILKVSKLTEKEYDKYKDSQLLDTYFIEDITEEEFRSGFQKFTKG